MEKIIIDSRLDYCLNWEYGIEISKLKKDIEEIEKLGATHVNIDSAIIYDDSYVIIDPICRRLETDEEFKTRKTISELSLKENRERELRQLEILKAKYE
jgi:hypothetical protein